MAQAVTHTSRSTPQENGTTPDLDSHWGTTITGASCECLAHGHSLIIVADILAISLLDRPVSLKKGACWWPHQLVLTLITLGRDVLWCNCMPYFFGFQGILLVDQPLRTSCHACSISCSDRVHLLPPISFLHPQLGIDLDDAPAFRRLGHDPPAGS